jgi:hypothetical protein
MNGGMKNAGKSFKKKVKQGKNGCKWRLEQVGIHTLIKENKPIKFAHKRRKGGLAIK